MIFILLGILLFFIIRITVIYYNTYQNNNDVVEQNNNIYSSTDSYIPHWAGNDPEFQSIVNRHLQRIEKEEMIYSVIYNLKLYNGKESQELEMLCLEDIREADYFVSLHKKFNQSPPPSYNSFKRLAILYERQKEYNKAARVCVKAISLGFIEDGTKGKMYGRLSRMMKLGNINQNMEDYIRLTSNLNL